MLIERKIQSEIEQNLFKGKIIAIYGARQVGKTTLVNQITSNHKNKKVFYLNCDEPKDREYLTDKTSTELKSLIGDSRLVVIDEAQRIANIGLTLKLIVDNYPSIQVIATGSSSFDLANKISEPLTGRKYEFYLYPFSMAELTQRYSKIELDRLMERQLVYGFYPEIINKPADAEANLREIAKSYLYKDVLQFLEIRNSDLLYRLLQALALQIGNEVSYNELADTLQIDKKTVQRYVSILEQAFVVYRLKPFGRNLRTELRKKQKIYFYDTGIRNALIDNLNPLNLRNDTGSIWENFLISERIKQLHTGFAYSKKFFWRTHQQQEIDYLEEQNGRLSAYEFKWNAKKAKKAAPKIFREAYPEASFKTITPHNYQKFINL
ncbi:MAG: ATP-binding protein [Candidatus Moranbacteria bacterium]|nr:ATP-binding protein [Candidatus Moranbacteria bacterium]